MKTCLNIIRWLISIVLGFVLFIVITIGIPLASITNILTDPQNIKDWLDQGGVYENLTEVIVDFMSEKAEEGFSEHINLALKIILKRRYNLKQPVII